MAKKTLKVKLVKSPIGILPNHKQCLSGLGLRKPGDVRELEDTPCVRGMVNKVIHLLAVEGI